MSNFFSSAVLRMNPSATMKVAQTARELKAAGRDVISLSTGEPDFFTPAHIQEAARAAAARGQTKYTPANGIEPLRQAIVNKLARENGLQYDLGEVMVSNGAKQVISNALIATINPGDEVIIPVPYWVTYPELVGMLGGVPVYAQPEAGSLKLTPAVLERHITVKTKWLMLNSPCNPSGAVYSADELRGLAQVLARHPHVHVMSDDIYEHLVYDGATFATLPQAAPELKARTLVVNGVSKAYAMTGWRIGYAAGDATLLKTMQKVQSQLTSAPNSVAQWAAAAALGGPFDEVAGFCKAYAQRRLLVAEILRAAPGLRFDLPEGAFYYFISCEGTLGKRTSAGKEITSDQDFARGLLMDAGVAVVPGAAFGVANYFRISFATDTEALKKACQRIVDSCASLK
ncbi:pyridoxal phosphate-dependent aminotransferase [Bordetella sp. N]|uniref:pyridoxal phosphate-dependent aminotransferase n=1 Tax=Bordetella sp. N TaxID=1746199 RepID=UPI00070C8AF3|nr:pyridoxal phosphate-dependent aminotransferase [Bordetella sp. N]ALM83508.1 aspartate aminotransferase [Bordetella sp. N]